jgi:hypothetical protein
MIIEVLLVYNHLIFMVKTI